MLRYSN